MPNEKNSANLIFYQEALSKATYKQSLLNQHAMQEYLDREGEKPRFKRKDNSYTENQKDIEDEILEDFELIFKKKDSTEVEFFKHLKTPKIDFLDSVVLETNITSEEIKASIDRSSKNKSPGEDGITNLFYKTFAPSISKIFEKVFNSNTCDKFNIGDIITLPKNTQCIECFNDIRPITLLNNDYKIYSSILAERIKPLLKQIIMEDQTGYVPNSSILENIMAIFS